MELGIRPPPDDTTSAALSWGRLTLRSRANLLTGAISIPSGDKCAAEFVLFDVKDKQLSLCRYSEATDGGGPSLDAFPLQAQPADRALSAPRLPLLLCPRNRWLASLEVVAGRARISIWKIAAVADMRRDLHERGLPYSYSLAADLEGEDVASARVCAWMNAEVPQWLADAEQDPLSATTSLVPASVLAVALGSGSVLIHCSLSN
eukprot:TRINITY_DN21976_c0_g1_i3.p1 TRINITY_DN21976_c0_g1~~TRINITY_DN21976_c0_g1_i3.p1  ORF type:complete len:205 (+),score=14.26 TRINITY_DN21976_c0_g1_i3:96-710(+)